MAVSLESRAPLLDHRVVEFALKLPWKLRGGAGNDKLVLKHLLYRLVPKEVVDRPKMGFSIPIANWLRTDLRTWAEELLHDDSAHRDGLIERRVLLTMWEAHQARRADRSAALWAVLAFLSWRCGA
jgi:asparagine synthase (glutamine-hydrolysing)